MVSDALQKFLKEQGYLLRADESQLNLKYVSKRKLIIRIFGITLALFVLILAFVNVIFFGSIALIIVLTTFYITSQGLPKQVRFDPAESVLGVTPADLGASEYTYPLNAVSKIGIENKNIGSYTSANLDGTTDYEKKVFLLLEDKKLINIAGFVTRKIETEEEIEELVRLIESKVSSTNHI